MAQDKLPMLAANGLLVLDFDRTLFDTVRFMEELYKEMERSFKIPAAQWQEEVKQFQRDVATGQCYDLLAHIRAHGLAADEVLGRLTEAWPLDHFLFPDSLRLLERLRKTDIIERTSILTYGEAKTQLFKVSLAPALAGLPVDITETPEKGKHLVFEYGDASGLLIDDKCIEALPEHFDFIQLVREGASARYPRQAKHAIRSLDELVF
jgi:hypothetical protein